MNKLKIFNKKKRILSPLTIIAILLTMMLLPVQPSSAASTVYGVDGRSLPTNMTGDTSTWIEIAQNDGYSLIIRKDVLPLGFVTFPKVTLNSNYQVSNARDVVNNWFKNTLSSNARIRDFTVTNTAFNDLGYFASLSSGLSKPTGTLTKTGNDIAFIPSFAEAANFCSMQYGTSTTTWTQSSAIAKSNYNKLTKLPTSPSQQDFWWLRSPGPHSGTVSSVGTHTSSLQQIVWGSTVSSTASYVYIRPALWVSSDIFETRHNVTVNNSYATETGAGTYPTGTTVTINAGTRPGYTFTNWTIQGTNQPPNTPTTTFTMPPNDVTATANWTLKQYTINYTLNGGTINTQPPTTYNIQNTQTINTNTLGTPNFTGYKFVNWRAMFDNGTITTITTTGLPTGTYGNITIAAMWDPTPISYDITYILNNGINAPGNPISYTVAGIFPINLNNPTRTGYDFTGWTVTYSNNTMISLAPSYSIPVGSYGNVTLFANWSPVNQQYSINYNLNGGVISGNPTSYSVSNLPLVIPVPVRSGFVFSYWIMVCDNGSIVSLYDGVIPGGTSGVVSLTAVWDVAVVYSISYSLNGGVNAVGNPVSYVGGGVDDVVIGVPSMSGYTFMYWIAFYADGSIGVLSSSGIVAGTVGDVVLIAVWYP